MKLKATLSAVTIMLFANTAHAAWVETVVSINNFVTFSNLQASATGDFKLPTYQEFTGWDPVTFEPIYTERTQDVTGNSSYQVNKYRDTFSQAQSGANDFRTIREGNLIKTQQRYLDTTREYLQSDLYFGSNLWLSSVTGSGSITLSGSLQYNDRSKDIKDFELPTKLNGYINASSNYPFNATRSQRPIADLTGDGTVTNYSESWYSNPQSSNYNTTWNGEFQVNPNSPTSFSFVVDARNFKDGNIGLGINGASFIPSKTLAETRVERWDTIATTVAPPVPEPETYALMGIGLVGLLAARRRKLAK